MSAPTRLECFKAYDIRGRVPSQLSEELAMKIGQAYAAVVGAKRVVIGHDIRRSSQAMVAALVDGLTSSGVDVALIGLCGTEEVYFATAHLQASGGIMVTASHNPADYNGMKLVREGSRPISGDTGLKEIEAAVLAGVTPPAGARGKTEEVSVREAYVKHLLTYVDRAALKPLTIVANAGNGCAGPTLDAIAPHLPFSFVRLYHDPDGSFPNGVPNPLLVENRTATREAVLAAHANFGVAWDGDFDRCFLFDEQGNFIEGYYIVGLLAQQLLARSPGGKVIHDPRLTWNTLDLVKAAGGTPVLCKSGHAFIKERMRAEDAIYGGEMSAHHYFRDFSYCDSGMIPWLLVAQAVSQLGPLSALVENRMARFPASGEINRRIPDGKQAIAAIRARYEPAAKNVDQTDGISLEYDRWRFNLRISNTEPLIRLNVEARGDETLMREKTEEILSLLAELGATEESH
ncbi:MAG: phosphomannomutase [Deltaproteobacteria bacterium]|nr:phosphomannomutase [Deltaproteobacteria bacterium]